MRYVIIIVAFTTFILYDFGIQGAATTEAIFSELARVIDVTMAFLSSKALAMPSGPGSSL